jgi:hypothetical protein
MKRLTKPSEVLDYAADLIEPEGMWSTDHSWSDGSTGDDRAGFCIFDALVKAHPQGKMMNGWEAVPPPGLRNQPPTWVYCRSLTASWTSMKEPPCGALGRYIYDALDGALTGFPHGLVQWNDAEGRTQEEVVDALRAAAMAAREEGK